METAEVDRARFLIPSIAVVTVIAIAIAVFSAVSRNKAPKSGDGGKVAVAGGAAAAGAASADEKKNGKDDKKEKAPVPVDVIAVSTARSPPTSPPPRTWSPRTRSASSAKPRDA